MRSMAFSVLGQLKYQLLEHRFIHTMRLGLIVSTLGLTFLTAILLSTRQTLGMVMIALVAGVGVIIFVYHSLELSAFLLLLISTIINPKLPRDMTITLLFLLLILLIWAFKLIIAQRSFQSVVPAPPNKTVLLFVFAVIISYVWSSLYVDPSARWVQEDKALPRLVTGVVMIVSPFAMLFYGNMLRTLASIKRVIWYFIVFGGIISVIRLLNVPLPPIVNISGQLPAWASIFAAGQLFYNDKLSWIQRLVLAGMIALWFQIQVGLGMTWLSGWFPLLIGVAIVLFLRTRLVFLLAFLAFCAYIFTNQDILQKDFAAEQQESGDSRVAAAEFFVGVNNEHFLFGTGPTGPYFYLIAYAPGVQLTHNNYFDIYSQTGVFGFAAWMLLWLSIGWTAFKTKRASPERGFEAGLTTSLLAIFPVTMVTMALGDWVTPFTYIQTEAGISYTIWPWLWAGVTIAMYHRLRAVQNGE
ncbi:MAG: hypothetical protein K8J31_07905, partial [Anaerolineae bacterium]|nr:hypothetical protein [Anaerolineae bacterium]